MASLTTIKLKHKRTTKQKPKSKPAPPLEEKTSKYRTDSEEDREPKSKKPKRAKTKKKKPIKNALICPRVIAHEQRGLNSLPEE